MMLNFYLRIFLINNIIKYIFLYVKLLWEVGLHIFEDRYFMINHRKPDVSQALGARAAVWMSKIRIHVFIVSVPNCTGKLGWRLGDKLSIHATLIILFSVLN